MTQVIVGAGMAGLLAACMLRDHDPVIFETQKELPNNHSAVLRFRSPLVGEVLGIPFRRVRMMKASVPWKNPVADALAYAAKVSGTYRSDRSLPAVPVSEDRWIAPPDLVERMADRVGRGRIHLGIKFSFDPIEDKVISTIPMPALMSALDYPGRRPKFSSARGVNVRARITACDAYVSLYVPNPSYTFSRISITGDEMIIEYPNAAREEFDEIDVEKTVFAVAGDFLGMGPFSPCVGPITVSEQRYHKIEPIDEEDRRAFIFWSSSIANRAFSLGRFACWRPGLLLDDLVKDVRKIDGWIRRGTPGSDVLAHGYETRRTG